MSQYRKKPVVIEAVQFTHDMAMGTVDLPDGVKFGHRDCHPGRNELYSHRHYIETLEGKMNVEIGDWVITGVKGEHYPCKPDIFAATYEPADSAQDVARAPVGWQFVPSVATAEMADAGNKAMLRHWASGIYEAMLAAAPAAPAVAPEGCTPADAKMLRAANHQLAAENDDLRRRLRPFAQLASSPLSWAMVEYCVDGDPEKQTLQAPQMQRAFNRAADALCEYAVPAQPNPTVPKWIYDNLVDTLQPAWEYVQTHADQFGARPGDDKNKILVDVFMAHVAAPAQAEQQGDGGAIDYDAVVSICDAHGIGLPVDCVEMVVEIIRHALPVDQPSARAELTIIDKLCGQLEASMYFSAKAFDRHEATQIIEEARAFIAAQTGESK